MAEPAYDAKRPARISSGPEFTLQADGDRVVVAVRGELDLDSVDRLGQALRAALTAAADGVDLDLGDVVFCDCSALNVLLGLRERGLKQGKTVGIRSAGPVVARLLTLTGTDILFATPAAPTAPSAQDAPPGGGDPFDPEDAEGTEDTDGGTPDRDPDGVEQELRIEVVQLRRAMQTRPVIDLARGILMASFALSAEDAWRVLVEASQRTNTKLHHLAGELVSAVRGGPPAEDVQEQLAAAVAKVRSEPLPTDRTEHHYE
ncbi:ANTAR domain-containing protein [Streptomyces sp. NPDC002328]|uniref:ANTAR domain-containing protein n=1 Tax=Streptomyces sp. NPDC002328 TaxID=3364642 RepID=UPI0036760653